MQIVLTLVVEPSGLPRNCRAVLRSAVAHGVKVTAVNISSRPAGAENCRGKQRG